RTRRRTSAEAAAGDGDVAVRADRHRKGGVSRRVHHHDHGRGRLEQVVADEPRQGRRHRSARSAFRPTRKVPRRRHAPRPRLSADLEMMRNLIAAAASVTFCAYLSAQQFDPATLVNVPAGSWPTYHGDYSGQRHSRLAQITPSNVSQLALAWAFQT